jgi:hypothetical protein
MSHTYGTNDAINFINGTGTDAKGRTVTDYLEFDSNKWEECHDHIQWAFPSSIPSDFNPNAPVIDFDEFYDNISSEGYANLTKLVNNYLNSLGLEYLRILNLSKVCKINDNAPLYWVTPDNHNYRRLSRLLMILPYHDPDMAEALFYFLVDLYTKYEGMNKVNNYGFNFNASIPYISSSTMIYWLKSFYGKR